MDTLIQIAPSWILLSAFYIFGFSLILVSILEWVAEVLRWRTQILEQVLVKVLGREFTAQLFRHVLIQPLYGPVKPAFIAPEMFVKIVLDMLLGADPNSTPKARLSDKEIDKRLDQNLERFKATSPILHDVLQTLLQQARMKTSNKTELLAALQQDLGLWFAEVTDHMTDLYKRRMQWAAIAIGLAVAGLFNFDILQLVDKLWQISTLTEMADIAQKTGQALNVNISVLTERFLFGWTTENLRTINWLNKIFGLFSGGMAIAYASQFVYQLLRKQLRTDE